MGLGVYRGYRIDFYPSVYKLPLESEPVSQAMSLQRICRCNLAGVVSGCLRLLYVVSRIEVSVLRVFDSRAVRSNPKPLTQEGFRVWVTGLGLSGYEGLPCFEVKGSRV